MIWGALSGLLVFLLILTGCSSNASTTEGLSGTVTESGSTTVQPLAEKLASAFMITNSGVKVVIQGGGSSVGIKAARDGIVNIGASSRDLTESEHPASYLHTGQRWYRYRSPSIKQY
jgi:phosphate transport system substrate-binding protein